MEDLADKPIEWDSIYDAMTNQLMQTEENFNFDLYQKTAEELIRAMESGLKFSSTASEEEMAKIKSALRVNLFEFASAKTQVQFKHLRELLFNDKNQINSFERIRKIVANEGQVFNNNYLKTEYNLTKQATIMAVKWQELDAEYLQFSTVGDSRVRPEHKLFDKFTAKKSDPIWKRLYTPLDWGCRCNIIPGKESGLSKMYDSEWANKAIDPLVKNTMFDNNVGITLEIFNKNHPYFEASSVPKTEQNVDIVNSTFKTFAEKNTDFFARGFKQIRVTTKKGVNGYTDMNGTISLTSERLSNVKEALINISKKIPTTFTQEDALSTLHHEFWHNANKPGNLRMTKDQTRSMELANEFVSRKTLTDFMKKIGGKLENQELTSNRTSTGYNRMVKNYDKLIDWAKVDRKAHLESLKASLVNDSYTNQLNGLTKSIYDNTPIKLSTKTWSDLVRFCKNMSEEEFEKLLKSNEGLLIKK